MPSYDLDGERIAASNSKFICVVSADAHSSDVPSDDTIDLSETEDNGVHGRYDGIFAVASENGFTLTSPMSASHMAGVKPWHCRVPASVGTLDIIES